MSVIAERLSQVVVGPPLHFQNLTLYPPAGRGPVPTRLPVARRGPDPG